MHVNEIVTVLISMSVLMTALWIYQVKTRHATIVDVGWAFGMGLGAVYLAILGRGDAGVRIFTAVLLSIWALRLALHLFFTRIEGGKPEDGRYQAMRARMGRFANIGFFFLFQAQALIVLLFMLPMTYVMDRVQPLWTWHDVLALLIWLTAVVGESLADKQLQTFKVDPAHQGKTCQVGLWRYSRHPNYLFEWIHWFTYPLIAWGTPHAVWVWFLPVFMFVFLYYLTGIPYAEAQSLAHRSDYAAYQHQTPKFFPRLLPKRKTREIY